MNESRCFVYTNGHGLADAVLVADAAKETQVSLILSPDELVVRFVNRIVLTVKPVILDTSRGALGWQVRKV